MSKRRGVLAALVGVMAAPLAGFAQTQGRTFRIGFLGTETAAGYAQRLEALRDGLRQLGYVEGRNLVIEYRWGEGRPERLSALGAELVRRQPDILVTHSTRGTEALKAATSAIPIVMAVASDPVAGGLVASLARPGGNVTGSTFFGIEVSVKRLEVLKDAFPRAGRVAILVNPKGRIIPAPLKELSAKTRASPLELSFADAGTAAELGGAFATMVRGGAQAVAVHEDPLFIAHRGEVAALAVKHRLPSIGFIDFAESGGLLGYGANNVELFRRAAYFVDKILRGAKPGDLPIEQPTKFELVVNLKTAKAIGVKFPQAFLARADRVIE